MSRGRKPAHVDADLRHDDASDRTADRRNGHQAIEGGLKGRERVAHLANNPRAVLVSSEEIVARVRSVAGSVPSDRLRGVTPRPGESMTVTAGDVKIHVLRIRHNPVRRWPDEHVGYLIEGRTTAVLHVGDADRRTPDLDVLRQFPAVDVALVPFWYVTDAGRLRATLQSVLERSRIVAMHIPPQDAASVEREMRGVASRPTLLLRSGSTCDLRR